MNIFEVTLKEAATLGGFPVKVLNIQDQGVDEAGNANSGRRGPNSPPDNSPVVPGRVEKTAGGIRHHADPSRYGGHSPKPEDDRLLGAQSRWRLDRAVRGLGEFALPGGDDREPDEEHILKQLAAQWWNGTEQQMARAQKTLAAMGWDIGQDESGDDDAGVFVIRVGDENGDTYMAFPHSELALDEASPMIKPPANRFDSKQEAFAHAKQHGGRVFKSTYTDPNTGNKQILFVVKKEQGVAEDAKTTEHYNGIEISTEKEDDEIMVRAMMAGGRELGHVLFVIDGEYLAPQDLEVDERYQGQGIAATMYDYVKSKGYKIRRSGQQTDAGAGFWDKHKPGKNVWEQGVTEDSSQKTFIVVYYSKKTDRNVTKTIKANNQSQVWDKLKSKGIDVVSVKEQGLAEGLPRMARIRNTSPLPMADYSKYPTEVIIKAITDLNQDQEKNPELIKLLTKELLQRRQQQGVAEAIKLNAPQRTIPRDELQGYADRIKTGTKTKRDKFSPIIHGSNIKAITKDDANTEWDLDDLSRQITTRPKAILGTNAKMEKSKTEGEIIYDLTLPALSGIVVDEDTGDFVEITTCPGAGACQLFCYARKGGYVMFPASSMSAAQALNFLVNDPEGYSARVNQEIKTIKAKADKAGIQLVVRWHDAGDFFSKEYLDLAYDVAKSNPDVQFYAYTKMGDVATGAAPANFTMNFSSGSKRGEEKKVEFYKQQNPGATVKQGVTVPKDMFFDLIARKGNSLIKDAKGRTQFSSPEALNTFKQRLAQQYKVALDSIITYDQMLATPVGTEPKWNVIVQPGAGDRAANRKDVIDSYLMFH